MARLFTCGFETTPITAANELSYSFEGTVTGTVTRDTTIKRTGDASRKCDTGAGNALAYSFHTWVNQDLSTSLGIGWYFRVYFRVESLPSSSTNMFLRLASADAATFCAARLLTTGQVALVGSAAVTQVGSASTTVVVPGEWYRVEIYGKAASGANDEAALRLNGELVASTAGQTWSENGIDRGYSGWSQVPGANNVIYLDDMALNDDQTAPNHSWPGPGSIIYLDATADSAVGGSWTAGAGATTNLFDAVNNNPPSGVAAASATDTSQIKNDSAGDTSGNYDVTMESYTAGGVPSNAVIRLVTAVVQHGRDGVANVAGALQVLSNPVGPEELFNWGRGANIGTYPSAWTTRWSRAIQDPVVVRDTAPVVRVGKRNSVISPHICGIRMAVEYTQGANARTVPMRSRGTSW